MDILISFIGPFRAIAMAIDGVAYSLLDNAYNVVMELSTAEFLKHDTIQNLIQSMYILVGVVAFFRLALVLVNAIIDPEKLNEKGKGLSNIFFRVVGMIIILFLTPFLFQMSYELQGKIVGSKTSGKSENIIFKTILGDKANMGGANAGKALQNIALSSLITVNDEYVESFAPLECVPNSDGTCTNQGGYVYDDSNGKCDWDNCKSAISLYNDMYVNEDMSPVKLGKYAGVSKKIDGEEIYVYNYLFLITTFVGGFMTYIIISFAIDIAVRMFELVVLEVLSPLFIATFVDPKSAQSGPFKNWLSAVGKSYANLYIKLAILALTILLISFVNQSHMFQTMDAGVSGFAKIITVIGLLIFAKKAPKWIGDMIGIKGDDSGLGGLSIGKKLGGMALAGGAAKWAGDKLKKGGRALGGAAIGSLAKTAAGRRSIRDAQKAENKERKKNHEKRPKGQYLQNWKDRAKGGLRAGGEGFVQGFRQGGKTEKAGDLLKMPGSMYSEGRQKYTPEYESLGAKINAKVDDKIAGNIKSSFGSEYDRIERGKEADKQRVGKRWYDDAMSLDFDKELGYSKHNKKKQPMSGKEMSEFSKGSTDTNKVCEDLVREAFKCSIDANGLVVDAKGISTGKSAKDFIGQKSPELLAQVEATTAANTTQFARELKNLTDAMNEASSRYSNAAKDLNNTEMVTKNNRGEEIHISASDFYKLTDSMKEAQKSNPSITGQELRSVFDDAASYLNLSSDSLNELFKQTEEFKTNRAITENAQNDFETYSQQVNIKWKEVEDLNVKYANDSKNNPMVTYVNGVETTLSRENAYNMDALITGFEGKESSKKDDLDKRKKEAESASGKKE